jgi:hypothetical protein
MLGLTGFIARRSPSQGTGENTLVLPFFRRVLADMNRIEL